MNSEILNTVSDENKINSAQELEVFKSFKEEGIEIPFPHRTVYLRQEKDWQK